LNHILKRSLKRYVLPAKFTLKPTHFVPGVLLVPYFILLTISGFAQKFPASSIPDSLIENANVVVRLEEQSYEIKSTGKAVSHERHVYTILNEKGAYYATYKTFYNNKSVFINSVVAYMYDESGKEIRHFKKKDMEDQPVFDGSSFVNDERAKVGSFYTNNYPYTVDFEEEDELTDLIHIPHSWYPQGNMKSSVEKSICSITAPADYNIRYKMINSDLKPVLEEKGGKKSFVWEIRNLVAYEYAPYVNFLNYTPILMIGLGDVELGGYKGNMSTWSNFARLYGSLQKGRDVLPEETKQKVHELTKGLNDPSQKVSVLYNYLQQNTHYVGIQLGIGGWQTYDAAYVATKKYGDCKALSNFMISLLKETGVKAHAVIIRGGEEQRDFVTDFTYDPFNHIICCVPLEKDTIWLECTSQSLPAGYLSKSTANRYGLFIDDDGGTLVRTPAYLLADNIQVRKISAVLDPEGSLNVECITSYKALCQDKIESIIHGMSKTDQLARLKSEFNLPTYDVLSFDYKEDHSKRLPVIYEMLKLNVNNYAQITGKRIFINPDVLTKANEKMSEEKNRRFGFDLKDEFKYVDSIQISIPPGYAMESRPTDIELSGIFGKYSNKVTVLADKIMFYRNREQFSGHFSASEYEHFVEFINAIYDADHTSIVLLKKN
jgi:Domain of Unknown Function with PDB structure (DUF3857)/Transglutaminase-like superfamily